MRKPSLSVLPLLTVVFAVFTLGFFLGRNQTQNNITVSVPDSCVNAPISQSETETFVTEETAVICFPIPINQAGKEELMALPGIGDVLASRILSYREENGAFSSLEELLNVEGIGKKRLEEIMDLITVGG